MIVLAASSAAHANSLSQLDRPLQLNQPRQGPNLLLARANIETEQPKHKAADLAAEFLNFNTLENGKFVATTKNGWRLTYSLRQKLQRRMEDLFHKYRRRLSYGAVVVIEPATGRVLAMVEHIRRKRPQPHHLALQATYPAASLFKIVTLAAALEADDSLRAESRFYYQGSQYRISRRELDQNPRKLRKRISLAHAFAKSNNPVFGALAYRHVGPYLLQEYAQAFGFNQSLKFDFPIQDSQFSVEYDPLKLARIGAGLWRATTISPLHAAMLAATIGNNGVMMAPYVIDKIRDQQDKVIYRAREDSIGHPISSTTAERIREMMFETTRSGTLRRAFTRRGKQVLDVKVGGKTGTLRGANPNGKYNWFVGLGPVEKPDIAVAVMVVNPRSWRVKASHVGRVALETFFGE